MTTPLPPLPPQPPRPTQPLQVRRRATGGETEIELSLDVPSDLEYVGAAVELIADELPGGPLSPRRIRFNFRTAFAEALANAIAYGNRRDPGASCAYGSRWRATPCACT